MENESIFKKQPKITLQEFTKYFYPNMAEDQGHQAVKKKTKKQPDGSQEEVDSEDLDDEYERERENLPDTLSHL